MVEFVTVMGVSSWLEICGYVGYHEPPMLLVIVELSITMFPVWSLLTKKMALPSENGRPLRHHSAVIPPC